LQFKKSLIWHILYFNTTRGTNEFLLEVTKLLVEAGVNINAVDKYSAISLKYAITVCKQSTEEWVFRHCERI